MHPRLGAGLAESRPVDAVPVPTTAALVATMTQQLAGRTRRAIGFPRARDIDFGDLADLHTLLINNNGDPARPGRWPGHVHEIERDVVARVAELFGGTADIWGYVSGGGSTEGVLHGMWLGRERLPQARVYYSAAAHYCVAKAARLLRLDASVVETLKGGAIDLAALAEALHPHRDRPALVVATLGTTMTEALDDIAGIHAVLDEAGMPARHIVVDAAFAGIALAADGGPTSQLLDADNPVGIDSICVSAHKSLGTPHVGGVVMTHQRHVDRIARRIEYVDTLDATIGGSRPGQTAVEIAYALDVIGGTALMRSRSEAARAVAAYAVDALRANGWPAWRHEHAWTVVLDPPPEDVAVRWAIPVSQGHAHIICAPGVDRGLVDAFIADLTGHADATTTGQAS